MISIIVAIKDCSDWVNGCLNSLANSAAAIGLAQQTEMILIDDNSRPDSDIPGLIKSFRTRTPISVRALRFRRHQHYTYAVAQGLSIARGQHILFFSHDMIVPPACLRGLLTQAARHPKVGILRPVSRHMDFCTTSQIESPFPSRNEADVAAFANCIARVRTHVLTAHATLIGDAMLITRGLIDTIGVFDTRFRGFMGDLDYGLRARHAGFLPTLVVHDAWLHHEGAAARKEGHKRGEDVTAVASPDLVLPLIDEAFAAFRSKWGDKVPPTFKELKLESLNALGQIPRSELRFALFEAPFDPNPAICEEI